MKQHWILNTGLAVALAAVGSGQMQRRNAVRDFDIREAQKAGAKAGAVVAKRNAAIAAFVRTEAKARPGIRLTPSPFGLPKMLMRDGGTLSAPSSKPPLEIARNFLAKHAAVIPMSSKELKQLRVVVNDAGGDAVYLGFNQTLNGIDVSGGQIKMTLTKKGEVVQLTAGDLVPGINIKTKPVLNKSAAEKAAREILGGGMESKLARPPELTIFPLDATSARLAYRLMVATEGAEYEVVLDAADGKLLFRHYLPVNR